MFGWSIVLIIKSGEKLHYVLCIIKLKDVLPQYSSADVSLYEAEPDLLHFFFFNVAALELRKPAKRENKQKLHLCYSSLLNKSCISKN